MREYFRSKWTTMYVFTKTWRRRAEEEIRKIGLSLARGRFESIKVERTEIIGHEVTPAASVLGIEPHLKGGSLLLLVTKCPHGKKVLVRF